LVSVVEAATTAICRTLYATAVRKMGVGKFRGFSLLSVTLTENRSKGNIKKRMNDKIHIQKQKK